MLWLLLWTVLVLGAAGVFFLIGRHLWRTSKALVAELTTATDRLTALGDRLADLDHAGADDVAMPGKLTPDEVGDVGSRGRSPRQQR